MTGLFGGAPKLPPPPAPIRMPDPSNQADIDAKRAQELQQRQRYGRESTKLTDGGAGGTRLGS